MKSQKLKGKPALPRGRSQKYKAKGKTELKYRVYQFSLDIIKLVNSFSNKNVFWVISDQLLGKKKALSFTL